MNNKKFWLRVVYIIILVGLTGCYIFSDVIESWGNWTSGLAFGLALSGLFGTADSWRLK